MNDPDDWNRHWDTLSDAATTNPAQRFRFEVIHRLIQSNALDREGSTLVDVGCGNGDLLLYLSSLVRHIRLTGIEPSSTGAMISAEKIGSDRITNLDIMHTSDSLGKDAMSDVVICTEVLEHLDEPELLLRAIREKLMKPGSTLVISVPGGVRTAFDRSIGHRRHFSRSRLELLLRESGFSQFEVFRSGFPVFNAYKIAVMLISRRLIKSPTKFEVGSRLGVQTSRFCQRLMSHCPLDFPFGWQLFAIAHDSRTGSMTPLNRESRL